MEACRFSYYTVWLWKWGNGRREWRHETNRLAASLFNLPRFYKKKKKKSRQMDSRLSKCRHVRTYTPHLYVWQQSIYCCRVRLCPQTNRKIVCQPSYAIRAWLLQDFVYRPVDMERPTPPPSPVLCRALFSSLFLYLLIHLIQAQCGCGRKRWKPQRIGSERLVTFPAAGAESSSQIE